MSILEHRLTWFRDFAPGMGRAVAERTILRKDPNGVWETWGDVSHRVALGNSALCKTAPEAQAEYIALQKHLSHATLLLSGRHLQHGDEEQPNRTLEVFSNCSTAPTSFLLFLLLLSGSGVGRCYDDDIILIDWDNAPSLRVVLSHEHSDFDWSAHESVRDAIHKYGPDSKSVMWFKVPDSREGWAQALEVWENAAYEKIHKDKLLILDFSDVRPKGAMIKGMQNRPASGPVPLMNAFVKASSIKGSSIAPWKQAMHIDHYFSECVLVGGARRSARMSTKFWRDLGVLDFIRVKRPIEFNGKDVDENIAFRKVSKVSPFLWSSNNSVTVDAEFWRLTDLKRTDDEYGSDDAKHARKVLKEVLSCAYGDGTGEPGFINVDKLTSNDEGWEKIEGHAYVGSPKFKIREETELLMSRLAKKAKKKKYHYITNPCGEVVLSILGGFCIIADVVPFHAEKLDDAEDAFRTATRAMIRVNSMPSVYHAETARTNRIGVGITGVHEFAWKFFRVGFKDLVNPNFNDPRLVRLHSGNPWPDYVVHTRNDADASYRAAMFWLTLRRFSDAVKDEAETYSKQLGVPTPHTCTTVKPSGSVSKLFGITEGWHLPAMRFYVRWVQFRTDDPLVKEYQAMGYPSREVASYQGTTIIGFPTAPVISTLEMGAALVTASEATPDEQFRWLELGEEYYIGADRGNQISYTLKYDPTVVDFKAFTEFYKAHQRNVRCCTVMPQEDSSVYDYLPEQSVTKAEYEAVCHAINNAGVAEEISDEHLRCDSGACPIDIKERVVVAA